MHPWIKIPSDQITDNKYFSLTDEFEFRLAETAPSEDYYLLSVETVVTYGDPVTDRVDEVLFPIAPNLDEGALPTTEDWQDQTLLDYVSNVLPDSMVDQVVTMLRLGYVNGYTEPVDGSTLSYQVRDRGLIFLPGDGTAHALCPGLLIVNKNILAVDGGVHLRNYAYMPIPVEQLDAAPDTTYHELYKTIQGDKDGQ